MFEIIEYLIGIALFLIAMYLSDKAIPSIKENKSKGDNENV